MNLFSSFDPSSMTLFNNWMSMMLIFTLPKTTNININFYNNVKNKFSLLIFKEFNVMMKINMGKTSMFLNLLTLIMMVNCMALFPHTFSASSHLIWTLSLSSPLWISPVILNIILSLKKLLAHLTPMMTPLAMIPFMVIIETTSLVIRPFTLAIRLMANIMAGHLILTLISNQIKSMMKTKIFIILLQTIFMILESAVAIIQAYVFSMLLLLYLNENI